MSYIIYINGHEIEKVKAKDIAYTKQVNDIARLDTRQSNFVHKFIAPPTAKNIAAMEKAYLVGNQSNVPYQKNRFDLIDADTGKHLIYNGWAVISTSSDKGYEINGYDGLIDFYKIIENKTLTDIGISDLNHVKDLSTIINSWNDTEAYKYIIADYNGKVYTASGKLNADYLVPSARRSYIWERIHQYAGYTYSGSTFTTEKFLNYYLTFPKPIPTTEPIVTLISNQTSSFQTGGVWYGGLGGYNSFGYTILFFPTSFDTAEANNVQNLNTIVIEQTGAYRLSIDGVLNLSSFEIKQFGYTIFASDNSIITSGSVDGSISQSVVFNLQAGDKIHLSYGANVYTALWSGTINTKLELIVGYSANFDAALVDFQAKDYVNDIMQHFGLTAFKSEESNHIEYLTNEEIYQNANVDDWSDYFISKGPEKYIGGYAQKNNFKYKYNDGFEKHNDGAIYVNNENLKDEITIIDSKLFSPESRKTIVLTNESNVYKLWDKQIKDDGSVEYKELTGRYYPLRSKDFTWSESQTIESELLGTSDTFTTAPIESFYRLSFEQIIYDNYKSIGAILDKYKMIDVDFNLNLLKVKNFDFKKLIYVKQLSSYFQVNRIPNFVKGQKTKVELIEVDYFKELDVPDPVDFVLQINNDNPIDYTSCVATFTLFTDIPVGSEIEIIPYCLTPDGIAGFYYAPYPLTTPITATYTGSSFSYTFNELPAMPFGGWKFKFVYRISLFEIIESNFSNILEIDGACYIPTAPPTPNLSYITITNVQTLSVVGNRRNVRVTYNSNLSVATMALTLNATGVTLFASLNSLSQTFPFATQNSYVDINLLDNALGEVCQYQIQLQALGVTSNTATS